MTNPKHPLRLLTIGCGGILNAHLAGFERHPELFRLVGACDPSEAARQAVAERMGPLGQVETFADHDEALSRLQGHVDAALVVTPHHLHFPQAKACVLAGIPVLVEKPVCNDLDEAMHLEALARKNAVTVMVGQSRRYQPYSQYVRHWVTANPENFGKLATFSLEAWQNILAWIATKPDKNADFWILDKERAGGGVVVSLGCHMLDLVRYLTGDDYAEVSAYGVFNAPFKNGAESGCAATLKMKSGAVGTLNANYLAKRVPYSESFKLYGTRGSIVQHADGWGVYEGETRIGTTPDGDPPGFRFQYEGLEPLSPEKLKVFGDNLFINQLMEFRSAILNRREPLTGIRDNLNTMAVIEAIYTSMNNGGAPTPVKH